MATIQSENALTTFTTGVAQTIAVATAGVYALHIDLANVAGGDTYLVEAYVKARTAGTAKRAWAAEFSHVQAEPIKISPAVVAPLGVDFKVTLISGTSRSLDYSVVAA